MDTLGDTLAKKAIETLRDSRAIKIKGRYYWRHTRNEEGKGSARFTSLQANTRARRLVKKEVETLGNILAEVKA